MQVPIKLITSLDRDPSSPNIYFEGIRHKKNLLGGIVGLAFLILTLYLVIFKGINIIQKNDVNLASYIRRDMSRVNILNNNVQLIILQFIQQQQDNPFVPVPFKNYAKYGITAVVMQISANSSEPIKRSKLNASQLYQLHVQGKQLPQSTNVTSVYMKPCKYYPDDNEDTLLCAPNLEFHPECSLDSFDNGGCAAVSEFYIMILPCDPEEDPACNPQLRPNLVPTLFVWDTKFNVLQKNTNKIFQTGAMGINNIGNAYVLQSKYRLILRVPVTKLIIESDESIMPQVLFQDVNRTQTYFYPIQSIELTTTSGFMPAYFTFDLVRSPFTQTYYRSYARVDTMLGQVFGLIGLMAIITTFCCSGYNQWLMKRYIKQKIKQEQCQSGDTILHYWKHKTKTICRKNTEEGMVIDLVKICKNLDRLNNLAGLKLEQNQRPVSFKVPEVVQKNQKDEQENKQENQQKVQRSSGQIKQSLLGSQKRQN